MTDLGTFESRARELTRKSLEAKAQRDQTFTGFMAVHVIVIAASAMILLAGVNEGLKKYERIALMEQEASVSWK